MPGKKLSMRRIKDVLRLHHELGRGQREIARCLQIAQSTVNGYLGRAKRAGLSWPLPDGMTDTVLEARLFPEAGTREGHRRQVEPVKVFTTRPILRSRPAMVCSAALRRCAFNLLKAISIGLRSGE